MHSEPVSMPKLTLLHTAALSCAPGSHATVNLEQHQTKHTSSSKDLAHHNRHLLVHSTV